MDFNRFSGQNRASTTPAPSAPAPQKPSLATAATPAQAGTTGSMQRWSYIALLLSGTILVVATIFFIAFGSPVNRESRFVNKDLYQAVFVNVNGTNGGQVYFGKVTTLTPQYIRLAKVFYIQNQASDGQSASASYNLVKLGCELHGPTDEMLINRSQVFFWENLKSDGQVSQKIAEYVKQNPNGQKCSTTTGSTQQSSGTTQTPAGSATTPTTTTPTTSTTPTSTTGTTTKR